MCTSKIGLEMIKSTLRKKKPSFGKNLISQAFLDISKKTQAQKTQGWKNSREFSEKLKPFLEKLKILPTQLDNIWDPKNNTIKMK